MWRITEKEARSIEKSNFDQEKELEELIKKRPALLDQDALLLIGQQVFIPDVNDRIDLLAIDTDGRSVIIEVKRGVVKDPEEIQAIRYASYVSNWERDSFERESDRFYDISENIETLNVCLGKTGIAYEGFMQAIEEFCDEGYELNSDQRIILVGTDIKRKVISVLAWLTKKGIDIRFVQLQVFEDAIRKYVIPRTVFPPPKQEEMLVGTSSLIKPQSWKTDGRSHHLEKRCGEKCATLLVRITEGLETLDEVERISWRQKLYVAIMVDGRRWMWINTYRNQLNIQFIAPQKKFTIDRIADSLSYPPETIDVKQKFSWDRFRVKMRASEKYDSERFLLFCKEAIAAYKEDDLDIDEIE